MFVKKILYTVCSANHLAHCKTMADSFVKHNPEYQVIIALTDEINNRFSVSEFEPYYLIESGKLGFPDFSLMAQQYSVIELNCAMKAFIANFIFNHFSPDLLVYLDADILVFHSFSSVETAMLENDLLITPHVTNPYPVDNFLPRERDTLRSGLYNAGFIAMRPTQNVKAFINWWMNHLQNECYYNFAEGMGADQLWLNLVPLLFSNVGIFNNLGANVAYWNLHERSIDLIDDTYIINQTAPLLFLHISGYSFDRPDVLSRHQNRYEISNFPLLQLLLKDYRNKVIANGYEKYTVMNCVYAKKKNKSLGIMKLVNRLVQPLGIKVSDI